MGYAREVFRRSTGPEEAFEPFMILILILSEASCAGGIEPSCRAIAAARIKCV